MTGFNEDAGPTLRDPLLPAAVHTQLINHKPSQEQTSKDIFSVSLFFIYINKQCIP